jgi:hypothetical protein
MGETKSTTVFASGTAQLVQQSPDVVSVSVDGLTEDERKRVSSRDKRRVLTRRRVEQRTLDQPRLHTQADLERSLGFFRDIRSQLEDVYPDDYVTVGVDTGQWAVGTSRYEASQNFEEKFGLVHNFTFHIGSTE